MTQDETACSGGHCRVTMRRRVETGGGVSTSGYLFSDLLEVIAWQT